MAWNPKGGPWGSGGGGPWGGGPTPTPPPNIEDLLRRGQERFRRLVPTGIGGGPNRGAPLRNETCTPALARCREISRSNVSPPPRSRQAMRLTNNTRKALLFPDSSISAL